MPSMTEAAEARACGRCCTKLEGFGVSFGPQAILEGIDLHIHCGEMTALVGPNGAGKTTLLRAILGEVPHTGMLHFTDIGHQRTDRPRIGYVPQKLDFDATAPISVKDLFVAANRTRPVWLGCGPAFRAEIVRVLRSFDIEPLIDRPLGKLSGGELQRVLLALAVTPVPDLLLLDEPVSGVDLAGIELFYETVCHLRQAYDLSIIMASHDLPSAVRHADRIVFLNRRIICDGPPAEALAHPAVRQLFGVDRTLQQHPPAAMHHGRGAGGGT